MSYLHELQADTLMVAGNTSGWVRATVVVDCIFDRNRPLVNLFARQAKYADVVNLGAAPSDPSQFSRHIHAPQSLEQVVRC